ncbi:DNA topoisomerase [Meloidogyne graminicola]|uniref:DNA topoisomerase n=1 Tax=Meloidogyne graminicola TaxID=189291 RepID=A0A8S9ZW93_9BILA|nr:DNA topoisomerase [Meloidogyne graminicola]
MIFYCHIPKEFTFTNNINKHIPIKLTFTHLINIKLNSQLIIFLFYLRLMNVKVLMVAEKPILAESIAKILSNGNYHKEKGWNNACSISTYNGKFNKLPATFIVTSTCGHVMGVDFPIPYNSWNKTEPSELFECKIEHIEANPKLKMPKFLATTAKGCDYLVLWLDCDKEGENICFEVIDAVRDSMLSSKSKDFIKNFVFRARFSAVTETEIKNAMNNLAKPNLNESLSVDARQELDLRIGCAFTRFQTRFFQGKYGDLDSNFVSYGPCQTPTLAFCVVRHDEIMNFKPQAYWLLQAEIELPGGRSLKLEWTRDRQFDKSAAQAFLNKIKNIQLANVIEISEKEHKKEKPLALNTVELLKVASSYLGLPPSTAISVAEYLYTRGYSSYPRTETTAYPASFDFICVLKELKNIPEYSAFVQKILQNGISKPRTGVNKGDHPPITPMKAKDGMLSGGQRNYFSKWLHYKTLSICIENNHLRMYEYITQHFLATLMPSCKYVTKTIKFSIGLEQFLAHSRVVTEPGFTELLTWMSISQEGALDQIKKGQVFKIKEVKIIERKTTPPDYLTESELISLMEKYGIGTDASIPTHITNICTRNYVTVETGRRLVPTKLGIALVHGYQRVDSDLIEPTMRADVEKQLNLIAIGNADYETMKKQTLNMFKKKYENFVENINLVDSFFKDSFKTLVESGKPFSRCGKCQHYMKLVEAKPQRLYCLTCQDTYTVPSSKDASIRLHGENLCPIDRFEILYFHPSGKLEKSFVFCPNCYNNPPFEDMRGKHPGCNECSHPDCKYSYMLNQGVRQCFNKCFGGRGTLVLDSPSVSNWKLSCNKCPAFVNIFKGASKLKLIDNCEKCGARKFSVEYKNEKVSKLPGKECSFNGCAFCEQENLGECIDIRHAYDNKPPPNSGRGMKVRGVNQRGRGNNNSIRGKGSSTNISSNRGNLGGKRGRGRGRI